MKLGPPKVIDHTDRVVCVRCHIVMRDLEPFSKRGEFFHPKGEHAGRPVKCKNAGKTFVSGEPEIEPFVRKRVRRNIKRNSKYR